MQMKRKFLGDMSWMIRYLVWLIMPILPVWEIGFRWMRADTLAEEEDAGLS